LAVTTIEAQAQSSRPERIGGHPNLNGIWQAANTAYWNLEAALGIFVRIRSAISCGRHAEWWRSPSRWSVGDLS
jgi:hypothetical protein